MDLLFSTAFNYQNANEENKNMEVKLILESNWKKLESSDVFIEILPSTSTLGRWSAFN